MLTQFLELTEKNRMILVLEQGFKAFFGKVYKYLGDGLTRQRQVDFTFDTESELLHHIPIYIYIYQEKKKKELILC